MAESGNPNTVQDLMFPKSTNGQQVSLMMADEKRGMCTLIQNAANVQVGGKMIVHMNSDSYIKKKIRPKKPLSKSTDKITRDQMLNIKDRLGNDWKDLGRRFDFDDGELDQMRLEHKDDLQELNYQILCGWQQRKPQCATQANLAKIFEKMFRGDLADLLVEESSLHLTQS